MRAWLRLWILLFPLVSTGISAPAESPEGRGGLHYIYTDLNAQALRLILHSIFHMKILLEPFRVHWLGIELSIVTYFKSHYFLLNQEELRKLVCITPRGCTPKMWKK